jgi:L-lactate dehydrogenase complex protein LldG
MNAACQAGAEVVEGDRRWAVEFGPDAVVCDAVLGVAENGAVWLPGARIRDRAGLLLAEHVVVILDRAMIVDDLHTAYARINIARDGFGMFMAGPSKTADIEQSLVIGAQGPKGLTILVVAET